MHLGTDLNRSKNHGLKTNEAYYQSLADNLSRFSEAGFELWITELDVRIDPAQDLAAEQDRQAEIYGKVIEIATAVPLLKGIKFWGITDRDTGARSSQSAPISSMKPASRRLPSTRCTRR